MVIIPGVPYDQLNANYKCYRFGKMPYTQLRVHADQLFARKTIQLLSN